MKLLLLNVLAMATACSSLGFKAQIKLGETKNSKQQAAPRLAGLQKLSLEDAQTTYDSPIFERLGDDDNDNGDGDDGGSNTGFFDKGDFDIGAHIGGNFDHVIDKPIITGPVFDPNPGSGGGSSSSSLPPYTEKDDLYVFDDFSDTAQIVGDRGILSGKIVDGKSIDEIQKYGAYDGIDRDFFRFSIREERKYNFNLSYAPGPNYYYEIYRYDTNYPDDMSYLSSNTLLYSSRYGQREHEIILRPATYFVCISSATKNGIRPELDYVFTYDYSDVEDYSFDGIQLTDSIRGNYDVVVWENEYAPFRINHFKEEAQQVCLFRNQDTIGNYVHYYEGCLDPIFMKNGDQWVNTSYNALQVNEDYRLDSVVYLLNNNCIEGFKYELNRMRYKIEEKIASKIVESIKVKREESVVDCITGAIGMGISIFATVYSGNPGWLGAAAASCEQLSFVLDGMDLAVAIAQAFNFSTDLKHLVSGYSIGCNITNLYERCNDILNGTEPDKIIAIPRFSHLYVDDAPTSTYPITTKFVKMAFSPFIPGIYSDDYYYFPKNGTIKKYQKPIFDNSGNCEKIVVSDTNYGGGYARGKMQFFEMLSDFGAYAEYGPWSINEPELVEGSLQPEATYTIYKSGSNYTLFISNYSGQAMKIAYNNVSVSDWQGKNFNFYNKDGYSFIDLLNGRSQSVSLGNKSYVYVRENKNSFATKISYEDEKTVYSDAIMFGKEYLKLAVVTSSWSWFVRTWTIRVRNLFDTPITFYYNKKMCFTNDAKNWKNLSDWTNTATTIQPHSYFDIKISENGTADAIGISWVETSSNTRYISYANSLNWASNTLSYRTSAVGI